MISKRTKKTVSILLALALLLGFGVSNVWADPDGSYDPDRSVSLTVVKYLTSTEPMVPGDGYPRNDLSGTLADGVEFTLYKLTDDILDVDLADILDDLDSYLDADFDPLVALTGDDGTLGTIVWDELDWGYYLLMETDSPFFPKYSMAAPSIITLPYTNQSGSFLYDVTVYPKNVGGDYTKTVEDVDNVYKPGDTVNWTIETFINYETVQSYKIEDQLDSRLVFEGVTITLPNGEELVLDTDFTATCDSDNLVTITLLNPGFAKIKLAEATKLTTVIETTISDDAFVEDGEDFISNDATLFNNGAEVYIPPTSITLASLTIYKTNKSEAPLSGAKFNIAATYEDALAGDFLSAEDYVTVDGMIYIVGIPYEVFAIDGDDNITSVTVWVVETQAADGYVLPQHPIFEVTLTKSAAPVTIDDVTYYSFTGSDTIVNNRPFELPKTGGIGTIIFTVVGLILISGAAVLLIRTRKTATK
ncbi:MAG: SpaH/EbpB family LPXTG-anchored major pilin [Peptococcaceae bacterium]|nr:SpaH/EbpB family LPXTG-anchored major pilin [Peptococcaceae bacterium]